MGRRAQATTWRCCRRLELLLCASSPHRPDPGVPRVTNPSDPMSSPRHLCFDVLRLRIIAWIELLSSGSTPASTPSPGSALPLRLEVTPLLHRQDPRLHHLNSCAAWSPSPRRREPLQLPSPPGASAIRCLELPPLCSGRRIWHLLPGASSTSIGTAT